MKLTSWEEFWTKEKKYENPQTVLAEVAGKFLSFVNTYNQQYFCS